MKIPVVCQGCGKRHEVDEAHAGKRGKCTRCGQVMAIPRAAPAAPPPPGEPGGYQMAELPEAAPSTFTPTPARSDPGPALARGRAIDAPEPSRRRRKERSPSLAALTARRIVPIGLAVLTVLLVVVLLLPPGGLMGVGMVGAVLGLILALY